MFAADQPAPGVDLVSHGPAGYFVCARAVENRVGCCDSSCHHPENRKDVGCDVHFWVWEASPAVLCSTTCYPPSQSCWRWTLFRWSAVCLPPIPFPLQQQPHLYSLRFEAETLHFAYVVRSVELALLCRTGAYMYTKTPL